jgi:general secretion pathway protein J
VLWWQSPTGDPDAVTWDEQQSRALVPGLQAFQVDYRGAPGTEWQSYWDERQSPDLVRLAIKAQDRYWPELVLVVQ